MTNSEEKIEEVKVEVVQEEPSVPPASEPEIKNEEKEVPPPNLEETIKTGFQEIRDSIQEKDKENEKQLKSLKEEVQEMKKEMELSMGQTYKDNKVKVEGYYNLNNKFRDLENNQAKNDYERAKVDLENIMQLGR